jgi:hypothetical protein
MEDAKLFNVQAKDDTVTATMCIHNFIRKNHALDKHFRRCDRDTEYMPTYLYLIGMQDMHHLKMHPATPLPQQMTYLWIGSVMTLQVQYCNICPRYQTLKSFWFVLW